MTDLSNLDNFLLEADFETINDFIGEKLLENNPKMPPEDCIREFVHKLAEAIYRHKKEVCLRRCPIRRREQK